MKFSGYIIWNSLSFFILPTSTHIVTIFPFPLHYFNYDFNLSLSLISGLCCNNDGDHGTYYEIEPTTGTVLEYRKGRYLCNIHTVWGEGDISKVDNFTDKLRELHSDTGSFAVVI